MHLYQLQSGRWRAVVQLNGERLTATSKAKGQDGYTEAQLAGAQLLLEAGGTPTGADTTVRELVAQHIAEEPFSPTYRADMDRIIARFPATFLNRKVSTVAPVVIDGLYRQLTRDGWTPYRIQRAHGLLGGAFKRAKRWGWVGSIPTRDANVPAPPTRDDTTPDTNHVQLLLAAAEGEFQMLLWLAAATGPRRGELCGLQWRDVDLKAGRLHFRRAVSYTPATGLVVGELKTKGKVDRKPVLIGAQTVDKLTSFRADKKGIGTAWLFGDGVTPMRPDSVTARFAELRTQVAAALVAAGQFDDAERVASTRFHDLRHYNVSDQLNHGVDVKAAGENVGQKRPETTIGVYQKTDEDNRRAATAGVEQRLAAR